MRVVWHLAISSLSGRRGRTILLVLAVTMATALSVAVSTAIGITGQQMQAESAQLAGLADISIHHVNRRGMDFSLLEKARSWSGVKRATAKRGLAATVQLKGADKKVTVVIEGIEPQLINQMHPMKLDQGHFIESPDQIVIGSRMAKKLQAKLGDMVTVLGYQQEGSAPKPSEDSVDAQDRSEDISQLKVVGIYKRAVLSILQHPTGKVDLNRVQKLAVAAGQSGERIDQIDIELEKGMTAQQFRDAHQKELPAEVTFAGTMSQSTHIKRDMQGMQLVQFLITALVFASAIFIILTSLTTAVMQRMRELAILRCIGTKRIQLLGAQLVTGGLISGVGAIIGLPIGILAAYLLYLRHAHKLQTPFVISPGGIAMALGAAMIAGLCGALYPGVLAARISPLEALTARAKKTTVSSLALCTVAGLLLVVAGPAILLVDPQSMDKTLWWYIYLGVPMTFLGYFLLGVPVLVLLSRTVAPLMGKLLGLPRALLPQSLTATPFRNGLTGGALMVGLAMLITIWTDGRSIMDGWFNNIRMPDGFVATPQNPLFGGISSKQIEQLRKVKSITEMCPSAAVPVTPVNIALGAEGLTSRSTQFISADVEVFFRMTDLEWVQGDPDTALKRMKEGGAVLVSREFLVAHGVGVGDILKIKRSSINPFADFKPVDFEVVGVVFSPGLDVAVHWFGIQGYYGEESLSSMFGTREDGKKHFGVDSANLVMYNVDPKVTDTEVEGMIKEHVQGVVVGSSRMIKLKIKDAVTRILSLASSLAFVALLIACFGVGNLIVANITSRQFEYGVLRAIGSHRLMLGRLVAAEAVIVALVGCINGTVLGMQLSWVAAKLRNQIFGLGYTPALPIDIALLGWGCVLAATLLAAVPAISRLVRAEPRVLLAADRTG